MPRNKKHSAVKFYRGTGPFFWLNFQGKTFLAGIIFAVGIFLLGVILLFICGGLRQEVVKEDLADEQVMGGVESLLVTSPNLLNRCQAGLTKGASVEIADVSAKLDRQIKQLQIQLGKNSYLTALSNNYQRLNNTLQAYTSTGLTIPQYLAIKQIYRQYLNSLTGLKQYLVKYQQQRNFWQPLLKNQRWFIVAFLVLIGMTALCCFILLAAVKSVVVPAQLMTEIFNNAQQQVFSVKLPVSSAEGLGNAAVLIEESLAHWRAIFLDTKNAVRSFDSLCKEVVTEIRTTELFAIQLQQVAEALTENFDNQNNLITKSHEQLTVLFNSSETLHKIPQWLILAHDELQNQEVVLERQIRDILSRPVTYQDESTEIAELATDLNLASEQVTGVINILNEITARTELLAFNSAIQAARAGEKGLGFGVVAKEIAKLVDLSKKASEHLSDLLNHTMEKNEQIQKVIAGSPMLIDEQDQIDINQQVAAICSQVFEIAKTNFVHIVYLSKVMEKIFTKSNELTKEGHRISRLIYEESASYDNLDVEILDYQLNVKESNRLAAKIGDISQKLRALAEIASADAENNLQG